MKKIFILTGEPSGDKLASKVISHLKNSRSDIEYLSVGGDHYPASIGQVVGFAHFARCVVGQFAESGVGQAVGDDGCVIGHGCI